MKDELTTKEISRLIDWLKSKGHTAEEAAECIKYIAGAQEPKQDK